MIDRLQCPVRAAGAIFWLLRWVSIALFAVHLQSPTVCAQSAQETALARSLFEEGLQAADAAEWERAVDRFRRAHSLKPTPGIAYNWACALAELGRLVEARERLRAITLDLAAPPILREESELKLSTIAPRIASLVIHVEARSEGVALLIDGQALPKAAWGAGSPTDPGSHTLSLVRGDEVLASSTVELMDGEQREVELREPAPAPVIAVVPKPPLVVMSEPARDDSRPWFRKPWLLWTAAGVAVVAGGVTTALLLTREDPKAPAPVKGDTDPAVIRW